MLSTTSHLLDQRHALIDLRAARDVLIDHHLSTQEVDARIDVLAQATVQVLVRCLSCRTRLLVEEPVDGTGVPNLVLCAACDVNDPSRQPAFTPNSLVPRQLPRRTPERRIGSRHLSVVPLPVYGGHPSS